MSSSVAAPFYITTTNAQGFQFLHILTNICLIIILIGVKWKLTVALICISLMNNGIEHLFSLLAICMSLEKCLLKSFAHFSIRLFFCSVGIVHTLTRYLIFKYYLPVCGLLFHSFVVNLIHKFLISM